MNEAQTVARGVKKLAWGYAFLYFAINIAGFDVLPDFVGWLLFLGGIQGLKAARPKIALLEGFGAALLLWSVGELLGLEARAGEWWALPGLIVQLIRVYFHFQLLSEVGELALTWREHTHRKDHAAALFKARDRVVVLQAALVLLSALPIPEGVLTVAMVLLALAQMWFAVCAMGELFSFANGLGKAV